MNKEIILAALENRRYVYRYLWRLFTAEPNARLLDNVANGAATEAVSVLVGECSRAAQLQAEMAAFVSAQGGAQDAALLERLTDDYTRVFIGPAALPAPPWESIYTCGDRLLFQRSTLEVRQALQAAGYQSNRYPQEPDDHIAIELAFMDVLAGDSVDAFQAGDTAAARVALSRSFTFLAEHLNAWLGAFAAELSEKVQAKTSCFYPCAAWLAAEVCQADSAVLAELLELEELR